MKSLMLLLIMTAMIATTTMAQEQKDYKKERTEWEKKIKDELNLTADQTAKYEALCSEYNDKIDAVLQNTSLSKDEQKEQKMALKKEKEAKLFEFLTPEQQAEYKELVAKKMKEKEKSAKKPY